MKIEELAEAARESEDGRVLVVTRGGKLFTVERDVVESNLRESDPYIYGWPLEEHRMYRKDQARWFYVRNIRLAEVDDQADV